MYFRHAPEIWREFPQLVPGVLVVGGIDSQADVAARLEPFYARARARLGAGAESDLPEVAAWRRAYAQMGMKPTQYRSAAEALLRRFRREDQLPQLHPLVDLCNAVSLAFALPVAVFDLARVAEYLEVRHARGDELRELLPDRRRVAKVHCDLLAACQFRLDTVSITTSYLLS